MACFTKQELDVLPTGTRMLEIGVGQKKIWEQSETLDINSRSLADHIWDLNRFPYPFADDSFDLIVAEHVIEHLKPIIPVMDELHRILKPTGELRIEVPHYTSHHYWTDPTHQTPFTVRTLDYIVRPADGEGGVYQFHYSNRDWQKVSVHLNGSNRTWLDRILTKYFDSHQLGYESRIAPLFQRESINFVMKPIK